MKRYLVFEYERYYPSGGASDFAGSYDSLEEVPPNNRSDVPGAYDGRRDYQEVLDTQTMRIRINDGEWRDMAEYVGLIGVE